MRAEKYHDVPILASEINKFRILTQSISFQGEPERCVGGDTTEVRSCMPESRDMFGCMYSHWNFPSEAVSISNYLMVKPILSNMTDSTICYWLISGHDGVNGTIFSYSHGEDYTGNSVAVMGSTAPELGQNFFIFRFATFCQLQFFRQKIISLVLIYFRITFLTFK